MRENESVFETEDRMLAAKLVSENAIIDKEIAAQVGISPATLYRWKNDESFQGLVSEASQFYFRRACQTGAGFRNRRIIDICNIYDRIYQVIKERAGDPARAGVPGGSTGLVAITRAGSLAGPIISDEYDTALVRDFREITRMIGEMPGTDIPAPAKKSKLDLSKLSTEDLKTLDRIYDKAKSGLSDGVVTGVPDEDRAGDKPASGS